MGFSGIDLVFSREYLRAALLVSLLSVWVLVGLFAYLNRYTRREYFTIWTASWLFYALWLTLTIRFQSPDPTSFIATIKQFCVAISAVFLLWGSLRFLDITVSQTLFGLFILFLLAWTSVAPQLASDILQIQLPVFILLGSGSIFAGTCFYRLRRKVPFVGAGMLSLGFLLWGIYLATYPITQQQKYENLYNAGFFAAAVLQLFIAVSMIVLVLEEVRYNTEKVRAEIAAVRQEKEALEAKVITTEEQYRNLYDQVRLTGSAQEAYDNLRRTQQTVVQQERLRALGQMASGIAHDINNALSPISAYSELLFTTLPNLSETTRRYLKNIQRSAEDIAKIVKRMREFYRRRSDSEQLTPVNINQVIEDVAELTRPRWRDLPQHQGVSIKIQRELEPNPPLLMSDPSELREALTNLVFNAVDAMPHGGTITFFTRSFNDPTVEHDKPARRQLMVEVRDNGIGMDEKTRQSCLEPFFSTKSQSSSGLGLAMVYGMVQRHDGTIEVESTPGRGTCIRLTFPITEKTVETSPRRVLQAAQNRSLLILCIDDEPNVRELLNDCLTSFNHRVTVAGGGKQGIELFHAAVQKNQPFEVIITDLGMPEIDGHQVARTIKAESPNTPVIMMTGWGAMAKEDGESASAVDATVGKPPRMQELNDLLIRLATQNKGSS